MSGEDQDDPFVTVAKTGEIADGASSVVTWGDKVIAIFREGSRYYAINDFCPHMGASLAEGHVEDGVVTCPWHAWRFCIRDGTWCDNPSVKTDAYEVRVIGDQIQIRLPADV